MSIWITKYDLASMVGKQCAKSLVMEFIDDLSHLIFSIVIVAFLHVLFQLIDEAIDLRLMAEHIVWRNTDLPGVKHLTEKYLFSRPSNIGCLIDDCRALSTKFKETRDEILGCSLCNQPACLG